MLSLTKNEKLFWGLKWFGIVLLAWIVAKKVPQGSHFVEALLARAATSVGGHINVISSYAMLVMVPIAPFILLRLKPVSLIAVTIALFPIFARSNVLFGIYGYTPWHGGTVLISGISLFAPVLFFYLLLRYPPNGNNRGWWLPSSKAFWMLAASGVMTQFLFFSPFAALRIAYLLIVVQLLWYLIMVAYVNTVEDACKIMWGIVIAVGISLFLTAFTAGHELIMNPKSLYHIEGRLSSMLLGSRNEYPGVLSSTICLLPILFYRTHKWGKILIVLIALFFMRDLLLTVTRGAYLSLLSIFGYLFILRHRKKCLIAFIGLIAIGIWVFWDQLAFFLPERPMRLSAFNTRLIRWALAWESVMTLPNFLTGLGMATLNNCTVHYPHQGFLFVWINSGLAGLVGFSLWLGCAIRAGIKKAMRSYDFEEKLVLMGLVLSVTCWIILFLVTVGRYTGGEVQEMYAILTTQVALLVALGQKKRDKR